MSTKTELAQLFFALTGERADGRWGLKTLEEKVMVAQDEEKALIEARHRREAEKVQAQMERERRAVQRGDMAVFARAARRVEDGEGFVARAVAWSLRVQEEHQSLTASFAEKYAKNPHHAMTWALDLFEVAGKWEVARYALDMAKAGVSQSELLADARRRMMTESSQVNRSSNPASNLTGDYTRAAWVRLVGYLDGSEIF